MARTRAASARLPVWQKVAYGAGDLVIAVRQTAFQFWLLPFYTDVILLPPLLAGLGKALGLVWDAVNDPVTGWLSDRTRTRIGRRRPFLLLTALPMGFTFGVLWAPPAAMSPLVGFAWLVGAYVVLDTFYTLYATPYAALGAELSDDYHERTQLAAARGTFHVIGLFLGGAIPGVVLASRGIRTDAAEGLAAVGPEQLAALREGFVAMGIWLGGFVALAALATGLLVRERAPVPAQDDDTPLSWRTFAANLRSTLETPSARVMLVTFALLRIGGGLNSALVPYAFRYWLQMPEQVGTVVLVFLGASLGSVPLWTRLANRVGKDRALRACMLWAVVALALLPVALRPGMAVGEIVVVLTLAGLGNGGWLVLPLSIAADVVDEDEARSGRRREGAFFGVWVLVMKLGEGVANALFAVGMWLVAYEPNAVQSPAAVLGIQVLYGPVPAACLLAAWMVFRRFPLTRARHEALRAQLAARAGGAG